MKNARNKAILLLMVLTVLITIVAIIVTVVKTPADIPAKLVGDSYAVTNWPDDYPDEDAEESGIEETEERVLMLDMSDHMQEYGGCLPVLFYQEYSTIVPFGEYLNSVGGDSHITENFVLIMDLGVKEVGMFSELADSTEIDFVELEGKYYTDRSVTIYIPRWSDTENVETYKKIVSELLDETTCSLIFINEDGTTDVVFDNYSKNEQNTEQYLEPEVEVLDSHEIIEGNYVPPSSVRNLVIRFILITMFLLLFIYILSIKDIKNSD